MTGVNTRLAIERCGRLAAIGPPPPQSRPWKLRQWLRAYRAIMAMDISELGVMLREYYSPEAVAEMANRPNPLSARMVKAAESRSWGGGSTKSWGGR